MVKNISIKFYIYNVYHLIVEYDIEDIQTIYIYQKISKGSMFCSNKRLSRNLSSIFNIAIPNNLFFSIDIIVTLKYSREDLEGNKIYYSL